MRHVRPRTFAVAAFLCSLLFIAPRAGLGQHADEVIRVLLFEHANPQRLELLAEDGPLEFFADHATTPLTVLEEGQRVTVLARDGEVYAGFEDGGIYALALQVRPAPGKTLRFSSIDDESPERPRSYTGSLQLFANAENPDRLIAINEVGLETYVSAVLDRQYDLTEIEGAKAIAVAIRTSTVRNRKAMNGRYDFGDRWTTHRYDGVNDLGAIALEATSATEGEVLTFGGQLIDALHFSSSGGHTASNEYVFDSDPRPYLRGKPDPFDRNPDSAWRTTIDRDQLLEALSRHYDLEIEGFLIENRSLDGRARTIALVLPNEERRYVSGAAFRSVVNQAFDATSLPSTNFTAIRQGDAYLFEGIGAGHGVGLSHWGAEGMAARGHDYREILTYYYTGVEIVSLDELPVESTLQPQPVLASDRLESKAAIERLPSSTLDPVIPSGGSTTTVFGIPRTSSEPAASAERGDNPAEQDPRRIGW